MITANKLTYYQTVELKKVYVKKELNLENSSENACKCYPFGLTIGGLGYVSGDNLASQKYKYNGKEEQEEFELGWVDYGRRMYNPKLGRFTTIDPWAERYNYQSPYLYAGNNPIRFTDFLGLGKEDEVKKLKKAAKAGVKATSKLKKNDKGVLKGKAECSKGVRTAFKSKTGSKKLDNKNANNIMRTAENSDDFVEVSLSEVQELANNGEFVVGGTRRDVDNNNNLILDDNGDPIEESGHVVMAVPGTEIESGSWGVNVPMVMDTGEDKRDLSKAVSYSWVETEKDKVKWYKYTGKQSNSNNSGGLIPVISNPVYKQIAPTTINL